MQEVGLPCRYYAVGAALCSGNLECLKLLLEGQSAAQNVPNPDVQSFVWDRMDVLEAVKKGFTECVDLVVKHGCRAELKVPHSLVHTTSCIGCATLLPCATMLWRVTFSRNGIPDQG